MLLPETCAPARPRLQFPGSRCAHSAGSRRADRGDERGLLVPARINHYRLPGTKFRHTSERLSRAVRSGPAPNPMLNSWNNALVYHEFFLHSDRSGGLGVATGGMGTLAT